jgi:hypothetical protein
MSNLKRYGERENKFGISQLLQCDDGEFVKFEDIKELLQTSTSNERVDVCLHCAGDGVFTTADGVDHECSYCKGYGKSSPVS